MRKDKNKNNTRKDNIWTSEYKTVHKHVLFCQTVRKMFHNPKPVDRFTQNGAKIPKCKGSRAN